MELFGYIGWITVPQYIVSLVLQYGNISVTSFAALIELERLCEFIILGAGLGLFLIGVIFGGFGLLKLAKRAGIKHGWIGFFPFANTYLTGKLAGETSMFGTRVKRIGLWAMLFEIVFVMLNIFTFTMEMCLLDPGFYNEAQEIVTDYMPASIQWMPTALTVSYIIQVVFSFVVLFLFCSLFFAFYRKYYARSPFLMTFLSSVLPGRGFAIFAVRNNAPIDYNAYMRRRMQQQQQAYGGYYGPQDGSYTPPAPPTSVPPEEPFGDEFGGTPPAGGSTPPGDDPFSDF